MAEAATEAETAAEAATLAEAETAAEAATLAEAETAAEVETLAKADERPVRSGGTICDPNRDPKERGTICD